MTILRLVAFVALLSSINPEGGWTQTEGSSSESVNIAISPVKEKIKPGEHAVLSISIVNHTKEVLTLGYSPFISSFQVHIKDEAGNEPRETDKGCRMHLSSKCSGLTDQGVRGSLINDVVEPNHTRSTLLDISDEYLLDSGKRYTVSISQTDFTLVKAPAGANLLALGGYPTQKYGLVKSNSVSIEVGK